MNSLVTVLIAIIAVIALLVILMAVFGISIYNRLVSLRARMNNAFAQIAVQLTRRHDLIPNIVESAKAYMQHEKSTLTDVIEARNGAMASLQQAAEQPGDPKRIEALNEAEKKLSANFSAMRIQLEAYPELKSNTVMLQLIEELTSSENRVAFARQAFNDAVTAYNVQRGTFPANLVAAVFGHGQDAALLSFDNEKEIQTAPKVSF